MKNLVVVAYSCEPNQGGEHELGWQVSENLSLIENKQVHIITRKANKKEIESTHRNAKYHFIESERFLSLKPKGKFSYIYYIFWQFSAYLYIKKQFNIDDHIHYITFGNIHLPNFLFLLKNPYTLGPLGGGAFVETCFIISPSTKEKIKKYIHRFLNILLKFNPFILYSLYKSKHILVRTEETYKLLPNFVKRKSSILLETGISNDIVLNKREQCFDMTKLKFITASRFIESKNIEVAIKTFIHLNKLLGGTATYTLIGDGPLFKKLKEKYQDNNVIFKGKISRLEVIEYLKESNIMLTCTVKEGGSHAIFEAMREGCLLACYDISGMKEFPSNKGAIKFLPNKDIEKNISQFSAYIFQQLPYHKTYIKNAYNELEQKSWSNITLKISKVINEGL